MEKSGVVKKTAVPVKKSIPSVTKPIVKKSPSPTKILSESSITLQKAIINMTKKLDNLSNQLSELLNLFKNSAEALAKKEFDLKQGDESHKKILENIEKIFDQNKTIAKSLSLLHEIPEEEPNEVPGQAPPQMPQQPQIQQPPQTPRQMPPQQAPPAPPTPSQEIDMSGYQKSISSTSPTGQTPMQPNKPPVQ